MIVRAVHITGFGKLSNRTFKFNRSLNIIKGFNEAGKTTLVNAILGILYGFKGRNEEMKLLKEKYRPWEKSTPYQASMVVNFGDAFDYFIERNFGEDKCSLSKLEGQFESPCSLSIEELLAEKLGLSNGRLFKSTLLVKQEEVADLHKTELADAIIRKITESGTGVSVKEILRILADRLKELHRGFGRQTPNPGPIKACFEDISQLKQLLAETIAYHQEYDELLAQLRQKQSKKDSIQNRMKDILPMLAEYEETQINQERMEILLSKLNQMKELRGRVSEKEAELNALQAIKNLYKEEALKSEALQLAEFVDRKLNVTEQLIDQANYEYQKLKGKRQLIQREMGNHSKTIACYYSVRYNEKNLTEARRLNATIANLEEQLTEKNEKLEQLSQAPAKKFSKSFWLGISLCMLSSGGIFVGNIWGFIAASVLLVSGIMVIYFQGPKGSYGVARELTRITQEEIERINGNITTYQRMLDGILDGEDIDSFDNKVKEQLQLKQKIQLLEDELKAIDLDPLEEEIEGLRQDANKYLRQINELLTEANVGTVEEFREKLEEFREVKADIKLAEDSLGLLTKDISAAEIDNQIQLLEGELAELSIEVGKDVISEEQYNLMKEEIVELENILATAREQEIKTAASVENFNKLILQDKDIWSIEADLANKEAELKQLELESKGIELAIKLVQEATDEARANLAPQVKDKVIKIFQWITKKRYEDVRLEMDGEQLILQYMDKEYNQYRDVHFLSTGTRDQLYLALRIALGEYLTKSSTFPIFLDDPFVNFDNDRLVKTVEILRVLAREHQIIWLTKDDWLVEDLQEAAVTEII